MTQLVMGGGLDRCIRNQENTICGAVVKPASPKASLMRKRDTSALCLSAGFSDLGEILCMDAKSKT